MSIFRSFRSTVNPFQPREWMARLKLLVDPITGAPTGIENPNANGADGIWTPIDLTTAQVQSPTPAMLADLNAVYRLNVAPYTRYTSSGTGLVEVAAGNIQGPNGLFGTMIAWSPLTISDPAGLSIRGTVLVETLPA